MTKSNRIVLDKMLDPLSECLTPESARKIVSLRADPEVQQRIDDLATKNTEGQITPEEKAEYEAYVWAGTFIAILQSKARVFLSHEEK